MARGWIRSSAIPSYASFFYKPYVDKSFKSDFNPVDNKLKSFGFSFGVNETDQCYRGGDATFSGFSETVPCIKQTTSKPFVLTSSFINDWKNNSLQLEQYLEANGWHKEYNAKQSINGLFSYPSYVETLAVNYSKTHGKTFCDLSIAYTAVEPDPDKVWVNESCERDVSFFGGSSG